MAGKKPTRKTQNKAQAKKPRSQPVSGRGSASSEDGEPDTRPDADVEAEIIEPEKEETASAQSSSGGSETVPPFIDMPPHTPRKNIIKRLASTLVLIIMTSAISLALVIGVLFQAGVINPQGKTQLETLETNLQTTTDKLSAEMQVLQKDIDRLRARHEAALALFSEFNEKLTGLSDTENLETRLAGLDKLISALQERSDENRSLLLSDAKKLETLSRSVAALREKRISVLPPAFSSATSQKPADRLVRAIIGGGPFEAELKAVEAEGQLNASLDWVRPYAREGIQSLERLTEIFQDRLTGLMRKLPSRRNEMPPSDSWAKQWLDELMEGLGEWISIRRTDYADMVEISGDVGAASYLAQIEQALLNEEADDALKLSRQLPTDMQADLQTWMEDLQAYVESRRLLVVLAELQSSLKETKGGE